MTAWGCLQEPIAAAAPGVYASRFDQDPDGVAVPFGELMPQPPFSGSGTDQLLQRKIGKRCTDEQVRDAPRTRKNPAVPGFGPWSGGVFCGGSYRDRTDDIHGVNVALYQLS